MDAPLSGPSSPLSEHPVDKKIQQAKEEIRILARRRRQSLAPPVRHLKDRRIARRILSLERVQSARTLCLYHSLSEEVSTSIILSECLNRGQQVIFPCQEDPPRLRIINDLTRDLIPGRHGIQEPGKHCLIIEPQDIDCFLLPGVAFDIRGNRIGFGSGYFDRALATRSSHSYTLGLAYDCQMFRQIPFDPSWDQCIDSVATENHLYRYRQSQMERADLDQIQTLAKKLADRISEGFRLGLVGPLGVGKTTFIQFLLEALEIRQPVTSPTFVLMNEYQGRYPVRHIDLYRIGNRTLNEEDLEMFLETIHEFPGIVLLEWADYASSWLPLPIPQLFLDFHPVSGRRVKLETYWDQEFGLHQVFL